MKYNGDYSWLRSSVQYADGHTAININNEYLYDITTKNRFNQVPPEYVCEECQTVNSFTGSYISIIDEEEFLKDPNKYIHNAYDKSKKTSNYTLVRTK